MTRNFKMIAAMLIWGSMGLFVRKIDLPSGEIALIRSIIGLLFLLLLGYLLKIHVSGKVLKENKYLLILSGMALGANWIFLFEAYKHTTIAAATLSYYTAPTMLAIASPLILKEKLTKVKLICIIAAVAGLALISGVFESAPRTGDGIGIACGVAAAVFYASLTLINKLIRELGSLEATIAQLGVSTLTLLPYVLLTSSSAFSVDGRSAMLLVILGVFHTGLAFWLFFSSVQELKAQTVAIFSYIDPLTAILLSALLINEIITPLKIFGAVLILGSAFISEIHQQRCKSGL